MPQCAISSCTNSQRKTQISVNPSKIIRYHRFPSDAITRSEWVRICGKNNVNVDTARVCSLHFSPVSYKTLDNDTSLPNNTKKCIYKSRLKKGVVPHLFLKNHHITTNSNTNHHNNHHHHKRRNNKVLNGVPKKVILDDFKDNCVCSWSDKEYPLLYALNLMPVKNNKLDNNK